MTAPEPATGARRPSGFQRLSRWLRRPAELAEPRPARGPARLRRLWAGAQLRRLWGGAQLRRLWGHAWLRRLVRLGVSGGAAVLVVVAASVLYVDRGARGHVYSVREVPAAPVVLVLGAQVYEPGDRPSPFLAARLDLARQLYAAGKAKVILVSGDNSRPDYNEPGGMVRWLTAHGVPADRVVADYAGFDTYDSCARAKLIFGVTRLIVVSQSYHIQRAVSLCRHLGIQADGVGDDTVRDRYVSWWRATVREQGACVKAVWDLTVRRNPVFLGPHESGVDDALRG